MRPPFGIQRIDGVGFLGHLVRQCGLDESTQQKLVENKITEQNI